MTTTRISHTGHNHPSTTAARTACRKAMKATPVVATYATAMVGRGKAIHLAVTWDGNLSGVRCGAGLARNGSDSDYRANGDLPLADVTCKGCRNKLGHAHG